MTELIIGEVKKAARTGVHSNDWRSFKCLMGTDVEAPLPISFSEFHGISNSKTMSRESYFGGYGFLACSRYR